MLGIIATAAIVAGGATVAVAGAVLALSFVGFTATGVAAGTAAAAAQSTIGNVVAGSLFASLQSAGVLGFAVTTKAAIATAGGAVGGAVSEAISWLF